MQHHAEEESIFDTKGIAQQIGEKIQSGVTVDPKAALTEVLTENQITTPLNPEQEEEIMREFVTEQQSESPVLSSRKFLNDLNTRYAKAGLDFLTALKVWKAARLNPDEIRSQVSSDIGKRINLAEARALHKTGSDIVSGFEELYEPGREPDMESKLEGVRSIKLTPAVKSAVEKIGHNLYRTKKAELLWKIDMKEVDEGQRVPYLVRVETIEATEEDDSERV